VFGFATCRPRFRIRFGLCTRMPGGRASGRRIELIIDLPVRWHSLRFRDSARSWARRPRRNDTDSGDKDLADFTHESEDRAQPGSEQAQREHTRIRGVRVKAIQSDLDVIQAIGEVNRGTEFTGGARVIVAPISRRAQ